MLCSRPAIAKLCPSRSSTVVLARRTISAGTVIAPTVIVVVGSIWLTSGSIFRLITPSPSTVGVKARPTPYFLNSTVIVAEVRRDRNRKLAAGEEARGVARERRQVRLGEAAHHAALLQRLQQHVGLHAVAEHAADHGAERRRAGHQCRAGPDRAADARAAGRAGSAARPAS